MNFISFPIKVEIPCGVTLLAIFHGPNLKLTRNLIVLKIAERIISRFTHKSLNQATPCHIIESKKVDLASKPNLS